MTTALEKKIASQRRELNIMNERCRMLALQLKVIRDIDYYKSRLSIIAPKLAYKVVLARREYRREIEAIFDRPFNECLQYYRELLDIRNKLVHRYTSTSWVDCETRYQRKLTRKTLTELVDSY